MPPAPRQPSPINPREECLIHAGWLLGCLELGRVMELDERRFRGLFNSASHESRLRTADDFARSRGCQFAYRPEERVATFRRVEATGYAAEF